MTGFHNTAPYQDWWDDAKDEMDHRCSTECEFFGPLKMSIATDSYGNKEVYHYSGWNMVEQTEMDSYGRTTSFHKPTRRRSDIHRDRNETIGKKCHITNPRYDDDE